MDRGGLSRAEFLKTATLGVVSAALPIEALATQAASPSGEIGEALIAEAEPLEGVSFPAEVRPVVAGRVQKSRKSLDQLRATALENAALPVLVFRPEGRQPLEGKAIAITPRRVTLVKPTVADQLVFLTVVELGALLRARSVTSMELTRLFLHRLRTQGRALNAVISMTPERALRVAAEADARFEKGEIRSPLQGIPTGVKDMLATKDAPTTWGAEPFRDQRFDYDAAVIERLESAGAPVLAKLSLGSLGWSDVWFGGKTRNPWNIDQGSGGSSAGPAAAVAAGLLPFAIGTEAYGSIMTPSERCRVVGLRPTFGRISRFGLMSGAWSFDKIGVLARSPEDTALVLGALTGADPRDPSSVDRPLTYSAEAKLSDLKIACLRGDSETDGDLVAAERCRKLLEGAGTILSVAAITPAPEVLQTILFVEGAAAFDDIIRSGAIDELTSSPWPIALRAAMYPSGVDYLQALRHRRIAALRFEKEFGDADLLLMPGTASDLILLTNSTGHPQIYLPLGVDAAGDPVGISLIGRLYEEGRMLEVAQTLHAALGDHQSRPKPAPLG